MANSAPQVERERARREQMWTRLVAFGDLRRVSPKALAEVGVRPHRTGHGIFRDKTVTGRIAPDGVALTLLDTGTVYDDAFDDGGGLYYYPFTNRGVRDLGEIESLRNASTFGLPVFVVLRGAAVELREVRRGWITGLDDAMKAALVEFSDAPLIPLECEVEAPFVLRASNGRAGGTRARFRFQVLRRSGSRCAFCPIALAALLDAVHVYPHDEGGSDDPRNGLVLCRTHVAAFKANLVGVEPETYRLVVRPDGPTLLELGIPFDSLSRLRDVPHDEALVWRFQAWKERATIHVGPVDV